MITIKNCKFALCTFSKYKTNTIVDFSSFRLNREFTVLLKVVHIKFVIFKNANHIKYKVFFRFLHIRHGLVVSEQMF